MAAARRVAVHLRGSTVAREMQEPGTDHRRATAERNVEAILDAAAALLERGSQASIMAVATEAGVSRVTVYAHFATHEAATRPIRELVERGRSEGAFRTDLPAEWLVTSCFALLHACGDEVRAGRLAAEEAPHVLTATVRDVFAGRSS